MFKNTLHQADFLIENRITLRAIGVVVIPYLHIVNSLQLHTCTLHF